MNQNIQISDLIQNSKWSELKKENNSLNLLIVDDRLNLADVASCANEDHISQIEEWVECALLNIPSDKDKNLWDNQDIKFNSIQIGSYLFIQKVN